MKKKKKLHEGKAKIVYSTDEPDQLILVFKDDATAFDGEKKGKIDGKGVINNEISGFIFNYLHNYHVPTHFVRTLSDREMLVKALDMIPVEVVIRNIATGSICRRFDIEEGKVLEAPILEYYLKDDERHDPMINESHAVALNLATLDELRIINSHTSKINALLRSFFARRSLQLVDFKLEYGRCKGEVTLGDEFSQDSCRLWDMETGEKLDKDRFRQDLGGIEEAYQEVHRRVFKMNDA